MIRHSLPLLLRLVPVGVAFLAFTASAAPAPDKPPQPPVRVPKTDQGVIQLSDEQMKWLLDAKFGMFIHWGSTTSPSTTSGQTDSMWLGIRKFKVVE